MPNSLKYCEYFNVDEKYFPCIDESAINKGAQWETTYPHATFISLLETAEKMLGGATNKSLWIHGAYGTGKSQCAYALKKILEVPEDKLRAYWSSYEPLQKNPLLLQKLIGHREEGIVVAYRYASGSISTPQQLFMAIQESVQKAIVEKGLDKGDNSLKESVISWLEDPINAEMINKLLETPKWASVFSESTADEIINHLKKSTDVSSLMDNIFKLSAERGITALSLTADSLRSWICDVIHKNNVKIVFIWDEFSDFFRQNKNSLGEFQKIVSICQEEPFYLVVVTHPITSLSSQDDSWKIVQQRFDKVEITLPDNIAFNLIGAAFTVKPAAEAAWKLKADDLNGYVPSARSAVMKAANITNEKVMLDIFPIHPMAALVLKNIASGFQSNQRSMFDFIKTPKDLNAQAFQYFIQNTSPDSSERPFLTIDMLWDFFYEKGKDYLSSDIRLILDTFPQHQNLNNEEKIVLKTILIMQAIDQRLGGSIPLLKPTDQSLDYAFEGDDELAGHRAIAKNLIDKGILILTPIADGKKVYSAAVLAGDSSKIERLKEQVRDNTKNTAKLVSEGEQLPNALALTPALKLRYGYTDTQELLVATFTEFTKVMDLLKNKESTWHFFAVLALAKTEDEMNLYRNLIKNTVAKEEYKNIIVIDALSSYLGLEDYEKYVEFAAFSQYYQGNNNQQSKENNKKAKDVLNKDWQSKIHDGSFIVYSYANQEGAKAVGAAAVHSILQEYVLTRYKHIPDFIKGLTETQLKLSQAKQVSRIGMGDVDVKGLISGCERTILGKVWNVPDYWAKPELEGESVSIIKKAIDALIERKFKEQGKIAMGEIYQVLEYDYGFSPCNATAFVFGFLLKEYKSDPYRYMNDDGHHESMTPDKLSEMIAGCMGKSSKQTYLVSLTEEEKAFYKLTEGAWHLDENSCTSPQHAGTLVLGKMRELQYPVWALADVDTTGAYDVVEMYIRLVQDKGDAAHDTANKIGKYFMQTPSILEKMQMLLTLENCQTGMTRFLDRFENGKIWRLAEDIQAKDLVLNDVKRVFSVQYSSLWIDSTGEDEIKKLIVEYEVVKYTNLLINSSAHKKDDAFNAWREYLKFIGYSCESVRAKRPVLDAFFYQLLKIANKEDMLPENMKAFRDEMANHTTEIRDILSNSTAVFSEIYSSYLENFSDVEIEEIKDSITEEMFLLSATKSNNTVQTAADDYRKKQLKTQLFALWKGRTGTKNPREWSERYKTPILICIPYAEYDKANRAFSTMLLSAPSESDVKFALDYLKNAPFFGDFSNEEFRDAKFRDILLGDNAMLLTDLEEVRDKLSATGVSAYDWNTNPAVKTRIHDLAYAKYNAGGSDAVLGIIDGMQDTDLRKWLAEIVKKDIGLGVKIMKNKRE